MKILITNDDGFRAPGIKALIVIAQKFADEVIVVAPTHSYSGMSHSITMLSPLFVEHISHDTGLDIYSCSGSPVDCIKIALDELLRDGELPDLILSGINHGSNSNISVIYSGTMGAATEGAFYGIPSLGLSFASHDERADISVAEYWSERVIELYLSNPRGLCWNINIPDLGLGAIRGIRFGRQTRGVWREDFIERQDPHARDYYWMSGRFYNAEPLAEDTDEWLLSHGYVCVVPVQMDLTDYGVLSELGDNL